MLLISLCIPTYSRLEYLKLAVNSCLNQQYPYFEICVSQDPKSTGQDKEIETWCREIQKQIPDKFKYNLNQERKGLAGNWNQLVQMAKGDYVIIIGDDDLLCEDFLFELTNSILTKKDIAVIFSNQYFIDEKGILLQEKTKELNRVYKRDILGKGLINDPVIMVFGNTVPMSASLIKRDYLLKFPFDNQLNTPEFEVFLKIALDGGNFFYVNKQLASYRIHNKSETSVGLKMHLMIRNLLNIKVKNEY
jgi:glycosyltransferase involved in cell wall biosynthesis